MSAKETPPPKQILNLAIVEVAVGVGFMVLCNKAGYPWTFIFCIWWGMFVRWLDHREKMIRLQTNQEVKKHE